MRTVEHHGRMIAYEHTDRGSPTIVCVHGSGGTKAVWKAQHARLNYTVASLDLADHGDSEPVNTDPGQPLLAAYVDDLIAVATAVDADVLLGHSLGGAVTLSALLTDDLDVSSAIVIGAGATLPVGDALLDWLHDDFDRGIQFLTERDRLFHDPDPRQVTHAKTMLESVGQRVTRRDFQTCTTYDIEDRLETITVPVLALVGEHDTLTPPHLLDPLLEGVTDATRVQIPEAAHMAMLERPTTVNEHIGSFIERA